VQEGLICIVKILCNSSMFSSSLSGPHLDFPKLCMQVSGLYTITKPCFASYDLLCGASALQIFLCRGSAWMENSQNTTTSAFQACPQEHLPARRHELLSAGYLCC
jgi:hypothetical protein